ncbi:unnamed protein product [Closterium sp. Naga37s-1]|nr:unnamed protein product [Closterium sp. Naga37s-1]
MATALVPSTPATPSPTSFADLSEDVLLHLLSRPSSNPNRELSPEDLARLEAVCYALRRPLLLPPNRRHSVVETAARTRCLRHPLLARVPADLLRGMAAQRRELAARAALRMGGGGRLGAAAGSGEGGATAGGGRRGAAAGGQRAERRRTGVSDQPAPVAAADQPPPDEPAQARDGNQAAGQGWAAAALAAGLAAVRLGGGAAAAGSAATGSAVTGAERPDAQAQQQVQQRRGGTRGRRGALRTQIVVGGSADAEGNGGNGWNGGNAANREETEGGMGERVAQVAGGRAFTVILTKSGDVYTMGQDTNGCCGHGQDGVGKKFPQPKFVEALRGVPCQQVATGRSHVLVLARDGTVYAFGAGGNGRLGLGDTDDRCQPTVVEGLRPEVLAAMLGGLTGGSNGDTDGNNSDTGGKNNETGSSSSNSSASSRSSRSSSSSDPYGQYRIVSVAAGASHSLAVTAAGVVLAFGRGHSGQLGGAQGWGTWAGSVQAWLVQSGVRVVKVAASVDYSAALDCLGRVTWLVQSSVCVVKVAASVDYSAALDCLGREVCSAAPDCLVPHPIAWLVQSSVCVVKVAASVDYSAALDCLGREVCSAAPDCLVPHPIAWLVQSSVCVVKVAASVDYSAALDCLGRVSAGMRRGEVIGVGVVKVAKSIRCLPSLLSACVQVHMWGSGYCGCLGNGSEANEVLPRVVEGLLHTRIVQVTLGKRKTLALDDQGRVLAFGWTAFGGLGVAAGRDKVFSPMPVEALEGRRVVQVSKGAGLVGWSDRWITLWKCLTGMDGKRVVQVSKGAGWGRWADGRMALWKCLRGVAAERYKVFALSTGRASGGSGGDASGAG